MRMNLVPRTGRDIELKDVVFVLVGKENSNNTPNLFNYLYFTNLVVDCVLSVSYL